MSSDNMDSSDFQKFYPKDLENSDFAVSSSGTRICTATARKLNAALVKYQNRGRKFNSFMRKPIDTFDGSDAQLIPSREGSAMPASEIPSFLMLISLLELYCFKEAEDPIKANQVFEKTIKSLLAMKMIPAWIMKPDWASKRENALKYFERLFLSQPKSLTYIKNNQPRYTADFKEIGQLGQGGFGSVYEALNKLDDRYYAIKKIPIHHFSDSVTKVFNEVKTLAALDNPHIVRYHSAWIESRNSENCSPPGSNIISNFASASKIKEISGSINCSIVFAESSHSNCKNSSNDSKDKDSSGIVSIENLPEINYSPSNEVSISVQNASIENSERCVAKISDLAIPTSRSSSSDEENPSQILFIQMELCKETLKEWLEARNSISGSQKELVNDAKNRTIFQGMLQGVLCIHAEGIIHRDLKPDNIFLKAETHAKIGDFGLATSRNQTGNKMNPTESDCKHLSRGVGTHSYSAPEQQTGSNYDTKSDIYSLGLILLEMYHPCTTVMERVEIFKDLKETRKMSDFVLMNFPQKADVIMAMTHPDPRKRPTAKELLDEERPPSKDEIIRDYGEEIAILKEKIKHLQSELDKKKNS